MKLKKIWIVLIICLIGILPITLFITVQIIEERKTKAYLYDVFHRCDSLTDWNTIECSIALSSTQKVEGKYSIKMTAVDDRKSVIRYDRNLDWSEYEDIVFWVYHPGYTNEIGWIMLYTDIDNYKYWQFDFAGSWTEITIDLSSAPTGSNGTLDLSNINFVSLYQRSQTTPGEDYYFDFIHGKTTDITSDITHCKVTEEMGVQSYAEMDIKGDSLDHFQSGLNIDILDSDDVLSWYGRIYYPEAVLIGKKDGVDQYIGELKALGQDSQFNNSYRKDFTTLRDSDYIIKSIIDNALPGFDYDDEIDNFTITYKYDMKTKIRKMFNYLAMLERAVLHYKPDGEIFYNKYDNLSKGAQIFKGTYNFEEDAVGTTGTGITGVTSSSMDTVEIISSYLNHRKVIHFEDADGGNFEFVFTSGQITGIIEAYINNAMAQDYYFILHNESADTCCSIRFNSKTNIRIYSGDGIGGNNETNVAVAEDALIHIKVEFSCTTDKYSVWIDEVLKLDDQNFSSDQTATTLDKIYIYSADACEGRLDSIGLSWDTDYTVGDNLKAWDQNTSHIKITSYTPAANRYITRTPVIGGYNDLGQVYVVGKASDADEQKYGINELQPWRDPEITNYTEAKQLADNLLAIYSMDTQMISMLVVGKKHIQVGYTVQLEYSGVFSITRADFLVTKRVWYPMNDVCNLELTDNILTRKAFNIRVINKFYDEDAQQGYEDPDMSESTMDGTVLSLKSIAELRSV